MKVLVNYNDIRWKKYNIDFNHIVNTIIYGLSLNKDAEISINLVDNKNIRLLNKKYRNIDKSTNVLSFETGDDILLGDIYISYDDTLLESSENNFIQHTTHLIIHGVLHLLGYDHIKDKDAYLMQNLEIKILKKLGYKNPYKSKFNFDWIYMIACGIIASFGFAPFYWTIPSILSFMFVYYLLINRKPSSVKEKIIYIFPFTGFYCVFMFWWILNSIYVVPELKEQFAIWTIPAILSIFIFGGILFSIPSLLISYKNENKFYRAIYIASSTTIFLWLREWLFTGFPWNPFSNLFIPYKYFYNSISVWGSLGLTFISIGFLASLIELYCDKKNKGAILSFIIFSILLLSGVFFGYKNINKVKKLTPENINVRIVQPAFSATDKASYSKEQALINANNNIKKLEKMIKLSKNNYDLIVFPETTYPYIILKDENNILLKTESKTILGANSYKDGNLYNSLLITDKNGKIENIYDKSHLVPFGENKPFGNLIPTPGNLTEGKGPEIFNINLNNNLIKIVPAICYEIIFSDSLIKNKEEADLIINITNDIWFGKTTGVYQHLDMVKRYSVESGLPVIRSNYSGISAFILPDGSITSYLDIDESNILDSKLYKGYTTIYRKIGRDNIIIIILIFSLFLLVSIHVIQKKD